MLWDGKKWGIYLLWRERNIYINHPSQRGPRNYVGFEQAFIFLIRKINTIFNPHASWALGKSQDFEHHSSLNFSSVFGTHFLNFHPVFSGHSVSSPFSYFPSFSLSIPHVWDQCLRASTALAGDTNSVPNAHIGWPTTTYEYSISSCSDALFWPPRALMHICSEHTHAHMYTHTQSVFPW